jgi:hypothetical protein
VFSWHRRWKPLVSKKSDVHRPEHRDESRTRRPTTIALFALAVAVIAIVLVLLLRSCGTPGVTTGFTQCLDTATPAPEASLLSAYNLWLALGNQGTVKDFLVALVGEAGPEGYSGSDGMTGPLGIPGAKGDAGPVGLSAYQLWLDTGNTGTPQDFLDSLIGEPGDEGIAGLSAYELWLAVGNDGSLEAFFDSLAGVPGSAGENGTPGQQGMSAYEIWLAQGFTGTESDFLKSLVGADGVPGAPGICTVGETGATGATGETGLSAYEVWLSAGNIGRESVFFASLVGPKGDAGPAGPPGATGPQGPAGELGSGDSASFWDTTTQGFDGAVSRAVNTAHPMYFGQYDDVNNTGISVISGLGDVPGRSSNITFSKPGVFNIAFSAQLNRTQGGNETVVSIWLRKNGVNVPDTDTDITLIANGQKVAAAWNFFAPVSCDVTCDSYQIMWSFNGEHTNIWYEGPRSNPTRPGLPSIIMTVNQVK